MLKTSNDPKGGIGTIQELEESGICSMAELAKMGMDDLIKLGACMPLAKQIKQDLRRMML